MKSLSLIVALFFIANTYSAVTNFSQSSIRSIVKNVHMDLDLTTELTQNEERKVLGTKNFLEASVDYTLSSFEKITLMNSWNGTYLKEEDSLTKHDRVQLEYKRKKILDYKKNGVDLKLDTRFVYNSDYDNRKLYGSYGQFDVRAYFGRPLGKGFLLNKYITYVRAEKYLVKDDSPRARDLGWRARVSPSYKLTNNLEASLMMTYTGFRLNNTEYDQEFEFAPSIRYQFNKLALSLSSEFKPYDTKSGDFQYINGFEKIPLWSTNIVYYIF